MTQPNASDSLARLAAVMESRKPRNGGDPNASYVARLLAKGPDAFLKKIGEVADLWFHCMVALAHYELSPADVLAELERREGTSGIEEKAMRKVLSREQGAQ